jgi:hypothetical protein
MLLLVLLIPVTSAATPIKGAGASSCGEWLEGRKQDSYQAQLHWIQGFISAYNQYVYFGKNPNGVFGSADHKSIAVWMDNYCQQNPLSSPHDGAVLLIKELERRAK